ncbi:hypothetical protein BDR22DRAFT_825190 [Usnea florida]
MNAIPGSFTYPPQNSDLQFDYRDSVVTSWVTNDTYPTEVVLTYSYTNQTSWLISVVEIVPANGSKSVALKIRNENTNFYGGFSIFYNAEDGSQQRYGSPKFYVVQDTGETSPVTYNQQALSTSLGASATHSTRQATPTNASTFHSATTSTLTSTATSKPSSQGPHLATKVGLGTGIAFAIAAMGLISFLYWREEEKKKKNSVPRNFFGMSRRPAEVLHQGPITGELDGHQRDLELPVGPLDVELEGSRPSL